MVFVLVQLQKEAGAGKQIYTNPSLSANRSINSERLYEETYMKKRIYTLATVLLIAMLAISPVYAGGVSIKVGLGSITADGTAWGFGKDAVITISASGIPIVACYAPGNSNPAPGQNPPRVSGTDSQPSTDFDLGKGKFGVHLEAEANVTGLSAKQLGCANNNWTAQVVFVKWDKAVISVVNAKGDLQYQTNYSCVTTQTGPNSTPSTLDDGTITCTPQ